MILPCQVSFSNLRYKKYVIINARSVGPYSTWSHAGSYYSTAATALRQILLWSYRVPQKLCDGDLISKVMLMALGGKAFGRSLGLGEVIGVGPQEWH